MPFLSKDSGKGGGSFEPVPEGAHMARCTTIVDLGVQDTPWGAKEKVYIGFEVPAVRVTWNKDDQEHEGPALIGSTYTNSLYEEANLGKHLISWRGRAFTEEEKEGFDLFNILDKPCMISVTHNTKGDKTYANITAIMGLPAGSIASDRETDLLGYSPQDDSYSGNFDKLPEWLQKKCSAAQEPQSDLAPPPITEFDSFIPF